jgi:hypothetical protein
MNGLRADSAAIASRQAAGQAERPTPPGVESRRETQPGRWGRATIRNPLRKANALPTLTCNATPPRVRSQ